MGEEEGLTAFQVEVAQLFFSLPEAADFLVAGGAALIAQGLVHRTTEDLDFFCGPTPSISDTADAFEAAAAARGWTGQRLRDSEQFVRVQVRGPAASQLVDIGVDAAAQRPPVMCMIGPSYDPIELCARKLLALFDRAEARDFTDVYAFSALHGTDQALELARSLDRGLTPELLAVSIRSIGRHLPSDFPSPAADVADMLDFFAAWADALDGGPGRRTARPAATPPPAAPQVAQRLQRRPYGQQLPPS